MVEITLNGSRRGVDPGETIEGLLQKLDLDGRWVVAELNGEPVGRDRYGTVHLEAGDRLELVRAVAGG